MATWSFRVLYLKYTKVILCIHFQENHTMYAAIALVHTGQGCICAHYLEQSVYQSEGHPECTFKIPNPT